MEESLTNIGMAKIYTIPRNITEHRESYIYQNRQKKEIERDIREWEKRCNKRKIERGTYDWLELNI